MLELHWTVDVSRDQYLVLNTQIKYSQPLIDPSPTGVNSPDEKLLLVKLNVYQTVEKMGGGIRKLMGDFKVEFPVSSSRPFTELP